MLKITFGNLALDLNIFRNAVEPKEIEDVHDLYFIETIVDDCINEYSLEMMNDNDT